MPFTDAQIRSNPRGYVWRVMMLARARGDRELAEIIERHFDDIVRHYNKEGRGDG